MNQLERQSRENENDIISDMMARLEKKFTLQWQEFEEQNVNSTNDKIHLESKILINNQNQIVMDEFESEFPKSNDSSVTNRISLRIEKLSLMTLKNLKVSNTPLAFLKSQNYDRIVEGLTLAIWRLHC